MSDKGKRAVLNSQTSIKNSVAAPHNRTLNIFDRTMEHLREVDKRLNFVSLAVLAFVHGGLVPTKISIIGIEISSYNRRAILILAAIVCLHLTISCFYLGRICHRQLLDVRVAEGKLVDEEERIANTILINDKRDYVTDFSELLMKFLRYWWPLIFGLFAFEEAVTDGWLVKFIVNVINN